MLMKSMRNWYLVVYYGYFNVSLGDFKQNTPFLKYFIGQEMFKVWPDLLGITDA